LFLKKQIKTKNGKTLSARAVSNSVVIELSNLSQKGILAVKDELKAVVYVYDGNGIAGFRMFNDVGEKLSPRLYTW
jgi:hypothetical protein